MQSCVGHQSDLFVHNTVEYFADCDVVHDMWCGERIHDVQNPQQYCVQPRYADIGPSGIVWLPTPPFCDNLHCYQFPVGNYPLLEDGHMTAEGKLLAVSSIRWSCMTFFMMVSTVFLSRSLRTLFLRYRYKPVAYNDILELNALNVLTLTAIR